MAAEWGSVLLREQGRGTLLVKQRPGSGILRCRILAPAVLRFSRAPPNSRIVRVEATAGGSQKKGKSFVLPVEPVAAPSIGETGGPAPPKLQPEDVSNAARTSGGAGTSERVPMYFIFGKKLLRQLSSFPLAIGELFLIGFLSAIGTLIEQGESPEYYLRTYTPDNLAFRFLTGDWVLALSLDHIYSAPYFLALLAVLAASLAACSFTRQWPMVKVARRWRFLSSGEAIKKMDVSDTLPRARVSNLATLLMAQGYQVFARGPALYAFKGLAGRFGPIGVHIAMLLIMGGATISAAGAYHGTVMIPQGLDISVGEALRPSGILSIPSSVMNLRLHCDKFTIEYRPTGEVLQFRSDLSLTDFREAERYQKEISVNDPLRYEGLTIYQTDWGISAATVRVDGSDPFNLVMAQLQRSGDTKLFGTFLPLGDDGLDKAKGISILARDLQSVVIYDQEGKFVGVRRPGSEKPIVVDGVSIVVDDVIGSTGLEMKMDPGVPLVYAGFGALMITTIVSYSSHSQVWAFQEGSDLVVGGKTNRAKLEFKEQLNKVFDLVPEVIRKVDASVG